MHSYETLLATIYERFPIFRKILRPGAEQVTVDLFLADCKLNVPDELLAFYRAADGGNDAETFDIQGMALYSMEEMLSAKKLFDDLLHEKQEAGDFCCWHTDWLPFADDASYDTLAIDTTGKATGLKGCVLQRSKDLSENEPVCIVAPDFATFIDAWSKRVLNGEVYRADATSTETEHLAGDYNDHHYTCLQFIHPHY